MFVAYVTKVLHLSSNTSDHLPLLLVKGTQRQGITRGKPRFRFEPSWCLYKETIEVVKEAWKKQHVEDPWRNLFMCIQNSRLGLLQWKREVLENVQNIIEAKQASLDTLNQGVITNNSKVQALSLIKEIDKLREANDVYWRQRSRVEWHIKGDRNTAYFHALSSQKGQTRILALDDLGTKKLHAGQKAIMDMTFNPSKVKKIIFSIEGTKAPGPDVLNYLNNGILLHKFNFALITLIPKVKKPLSMIQFRPIAFCNTVVKIIAKALAMTLKNVLPTIISETQSAFVSNRLITDNVFLSYELHHIIKHKKTESLGYMYIKLDMMKAYDRIE
ncbi:hypothetical protein LIER_21558 [Lithospermum erythrorhizon]|uniref:Reverse transcriptase domain-containing protein n=1 Tax=Lithospermum erythrorhizon TaxID=34254 RepID=A0AAV3QTQ9_LITER